MVGPLSAYRVLPNYLAAAGVVDRPASGFADTMPAAAARNGMTMASERREFAMAAPRFAGSHEWSAHSSAAHADLGIARRAGAFLLDLYAMSRNVPVSQFQRVLETCGCAMIGQTAEIAPADRKL